MPELHYTNGWYVPNKNDALGKELSAGGYQSAQRQAIIDLLTQRGCEFNHCLDIGAHIGLWTKPLLDHFKQVTAFEPIPILNQCFEKNVPAERVTLYKIALGSETGRIKVNLDDENTGNTHISPEGNIQVDMDRLDNFDLGKVDYIKMDVEGYELEVLKGAVGLLDKQSPVIHLELKMGNLRRLGLDKDKVRYWLGLIGYKQVLKSKSEYVFCRD